LLKDNKKWLEKDGTKKVGIWVGDDIFEIDDVFW